MGKRYEQHSDMCGCERCALQYEREFPQPVFDVVEDPDILDCGCSAWRGCTCYDYEPFDEGDYEEAARDRREFERDRTPDVNIKGDGE